VTKARAKVHMCSTSRITTLARLLQNRKSPRKGPNKVKLTSPQNRNQKQAERIAKRRAMRMIDSLQILTAGDNADDSIRRNDIDVDQFDAVCPLVFAQHIAYPKVRSLKTRP